MDAIVKTMTAEAFDAFADLPENDDKILEFIAGEIVEVPSDARASEYGSTVLFFIKLHLRENNLKGHVTGEAGGYRVMGERYAPDVAYMAFDKQPELASSGYNPIPPDLVVEVDLPSTIKSQRQLRTKIANYLTAGTVVLVLIPETKEVEVYVPGQAVQILDINGVIDGGDVLPGFKLPVKEIFSD